ncbi:MAG: MinD/ParA family protein [Thermodesulfobacteriota bacterium]
MKPTGLLEETEDLSPKMTSQPGPQLRVIAVTSGKGGVGKSNVVANLGLALAQAGLKVLLIDADLGLANLDIILGLNPQYTIHDVLQLRKTLAEVLVEGPGGLKILPASSGIPELSELDEYQKLFLLNELDNYSESVDVVLIDTGAGISRNVLFFNIAAQERLVVANNEPTSITDAYALIKVLATQHNERRFKLLVNGLSNPRDAEAVYRTLLKVAERFLGRDISLEYLGFIPHDDSVPKAVLKQQPVLTLFPKARVSRSFTQIAQRLWETPGPEEVDGNIKFFWRRLLQFRI